MTDRALRAGESIIVVFTGGAFVRRSSLAASLIHPWDEPMGVCTRKNSLAAILIHPWDEPTGVCTRKSATVIDWRILTAP